MLHRAAVLGGIVALVGCGGAATVTTAQTSPPDQAPPPTALVELLDDASWTRALATGEDTWEVWVCRVPIDTVAAPYAGLALRLPLDPEVVADQLETYVGPYFEDLSDGRYQPRFTPGGEVQLGPKDDPDDCRAAAIDRAGPVTHGVVAVADAEHASGPGGFGSAGDPCGPPPCPATATGRSVYVGASDFHPDWGEVPAVDLVEHELGHALGWPHSADATDGEAAGHGYASAIDVMSNSAAPRETDPDRRHGPGTLALNRLAVGWLTMDDTITVPADGGEVGLVPRDADAGTRLALVGLDDHRLLTVELLTAKGVDDHLPADGIAVHLVDIAGSACGRPPTDRCGPLERLQQPLVGEAPYTDLLRPGESWTAEGWRITVTDGGAAWRVRLTPAE